MKARTFEEIPLGLRLPVGRLGIVVVFLLATHAAPATADEVQGIVHFVGTVSATVPGVNLEDIEVTVKSTTEATGSGEKCSILAVTSDHVSSGGTYPDTGDVSAEIKLEHGGPQPLEGDCIVTVQARGTDGVSVSARGAQVLFVSAADISGGNTLVADITARESKAVAGLEKECFKWVKKQLAKRTRCNFLLLKKGPEKADKCKDAGPEPVGCDPGDHVEAILGLAHGMNDQQTNPELAEAVDFTELRDQVICQKHFGKAAFKFAKKRMTQVRRKCLDANLDSETCRADRSKDSKNKLDQIDRCVGDQLVDGATGRIVPDVEPPCDTCIDGLGVIDRKCMKGCFQLVVDELTDGIIGDLPVCGDGILQPPEFCDDGNLTDLDCCSSTCTAENLGDQTCGVGECEVTVPVCQSGEPVTCVPGTPGTEGPSGDPTCIDELDNDCDGDTDGADTDCQ